MKILHTVELYSPSVGGMQEVVKQLSERLVKLGHNVTVATTKLSDRKENVINGVKIVEFDISGNSVRGMNGEVGAYRDYLLKTDFDLITNFAAQQWATDIMLPLLEKIKAKKVFVPTGFSGLYMSQYKEYFEEMKSWVRQYDMNVFLSHDYRDINFAHECGANNITVVPNAASEEEFVSSSNIPIRQKINIPEEHFLILHVGSHTGGKGHRELIEIFRRSRIRDATLLIVANAFGGGCVRRCRRKTLLFNLSPLRLIDGKKIINVSLSREETVAAYKEADIFLFPSNIECSPLVLFESMASNTPFLTTEVGNSREIIDWSGGGEVLPTVIGSNGYSIADIEGSARRLEVLYNNSDKLELLSFSGFKSWQERFTWGKIAKEYENMYRRLIREGQ